MSAIEKMRHHKAKDNLLWEDVIDFDFVEWLTREIILLNPKDSCHIVGRIEDWLLSLVPDIRHFLKDSLDLDIHMGKLHLINTRYGTDFLGAFVRPYRNYVSNATLRRTKDNINRLNFNDEDAVFRSVNSFLGTLVHYKSYNLRRMLFYQDRFLQIGKFDRNITKFKLR